MRERSSASVAATRTSAPSSGPPSSARRTSSSSRAARRSGSVGVPSRRSVPGTFPVSTVSPVQSSTSSTIWNAIPSNRPKVGLPPPSTQAAANSDPVFNAHRSRYASTLVVGSFRWRRCNASPRASASDASARTTTCSREPVRARRANAAANRWSPAAFAASAPCAVHAAARPRRRCAPSTMSSCTSEAMCTSSTEAPAARGRACPGGEERNVRAGRRRFPPAASASAPTAATSPGWARTTAARRARPGEVAVQAGSATDECEGAAHRSQRNRPGRLGGAGKG